MSSEADFLVLDAIHRHQPRSQRLLARRAGMSLGKTNYVVRRLIDMGLVKVKNLKRGPYKGNSIYLLTAEGSRLRAQLVAAFIKARMEEFEDFRRRLLENLQRLEVQGVGRLLVLGSAGVGKLLAHIARAENLDIRIVGCISAPEDLDRFTPESYDSILVAGDPKGFTPLLKDRQIPEEKICRLK